MTRTRAVALAVAASAGTLVGVTALTGAEAAPDDKVVNFTIRQTDPNTSNVPSGGRANAEVLCDAGEKAIGGAWDTKDPTADVFPTRSKLGGTPDLWAFTFYNQSNKAQVVNSYAICVK